MATKQVTSPEPSKRDFQVNLGSPEAYYPRKFQSQSLGQSDTFYRYKSDLTTANEYTGNVPLGRTSKEVKLDIHTDTALDEASRLGFLCNPAQSCKAIYQSNSSAVSGPYWIKTETENKKSLIYCHMEDITDCNLNDDGGWTLAVKLSGFKTTFVYDSAYWSNKESYNPNAGMTGLDDQETKTAAYWSTSFENICLGMNVSGDLRWIRLKKNCLSLHHLVAPGIFVSSHIERAKWKDLVSGSSLQYNCNKQGVNVICSGKKARFGIISNNQNDCKTCDTWLGFGTHKVQNSCGNEAGPNWYPDNGQKHVKAIGYILVK